MRTRHNAYSFRHFSLQPTQSSISAPAGYARVTTQASHCISLAEHSSRDRSVAVTCVPHHANSLGCLDMLKIRKPKFRLSPITQLLYTIIDGLARTASDAFLHPIRQSSYHTEFARAARQDDLSATAAQDSLSDGICNNSKLNDGNAAFRQLILYRCQEWCAHPVGMD